MLHTNIDARDPIAGRREGATSCSRAQIVARRDGASGVAEEIKVGRRVADGCARRVCSTGGGIVVVAGTIAADAGRWRDGRAGTGARVLPDTWVVAGRHAAGLAAHEWRRGGDGRAVGGLAVVALLLERDPLAARIKRIAGGRVEVNVAVDR